MSPGSRCIGIRRACPQPRPLGTGNAPSAEKSAHPRAAAHGSAGTQSPSSATEGASVFNAEVTPPQSPAGGPTPAPVALSPWMEVVQQLPPPFHFLPQWRDFLAQPCGRCYFPSPTHSYWNRDQDSLRVCFLSLGNAWSLLPCNTPAVSFIKSCPGKCLIHSCRRPTAGRARAFRTLGAGTTASAWQQSPRCFSNVHGCQGAGNAALLSTRLFADRT